MSSHSSEHVYCARQINIPATLPGILKSYVKAAIRTQPADLLRWTAAYFRALENSDIPPAKTRLELPVLDDPPKITAGYLKSLLMQYGRVDKVALGSLLDNWRAIGLPEEQLYQIFRIGDFFGHPECEFEKFLAIACGFIGNNLLETMIKVCEVVTDEPEGGSAAIPLKCFMRLYAYLAGLSCTGESASSSDRTCICDQDFASGDCSQCTCQDMFFGSSGSDVTRAASLGRVSSQSGSSESLSCLCLPAEVDEFRRKMQNMYPEPPRVPGIGSTIAEEQIDRVCVWMTECAQRQEGLVGPRNLNHFLCPPLY